MNKGHLNVKKSRRNKGFSLLEIGAALVVVGLMSAAISVMIADYGAQRKAKTAADKLSVVHEAANGYIKANYSALMEDTKNNRKVVIASGRKSINDQPPIDSLQRKGFLPAGFIDTNAYGQQHSLIVRQVKPTSGDPYLEAIVTTHGGQKIPDDQLGRVAGYVGVSGGYFGSSKLNTINPSDANTIVGNFGGWRSPVSDWTGGGVALTEGHVQSTLAFENGNLLTDYLYRNEVPGVPEANRMNTSIDMNEQNIRNVDTLTGVAKAGKGNVVTIDGNFEAIDVWTANANVSGNIAVDGNSTVAGNSVVNGSSVVGGDFGVGGVSVFTNKATFRGDVEADGSATFNRNVKIGAGVDQAKNGALVVKGGVDIDGDIATKGKVDIDGDLTTKGTADLKEIDLSNAYLVMADNAGRGDSRFPSENGRIKLRYLLPKTVAQYSYQVSETRPNVFKPVCGPGGEQKIMVYRQVESYNGDVVSGKTTITSGVYAGSSSLGSNYWGIRWEGTAADPRIPRTAIAQTFCSYR
jgi:type II secretory pathway pseudopilin PulG